MKLHKLQKPFSMIREFHLADWFTLANAVCGTGALFSMLTYLQTTDVRHVYFACGLVVAALIFDVLDGRIARWRQSPDISTRLLHARAPLGYERGAIVWHRHPDPAAHTPAGLPHEAAG